MWLDVLLLQASRSVHNASGSKRLVRLIYEDLQPGVSERPMTVQTHGPAEKNVSSIYLQRPSWKQDLKGTTCLVRNRPEPLVGTGCFREGRRCYQYPPSWGPSRCRRSKTWRSPSSPQIHQKYIYMWDNSYRTPTKCWQKPSDFPKGKKLPM